MKKQTTKKTFEQELFDYLGGYKAKVIADKLGEKDIKHICALLLIEWAQGRVKL